MNRTDRTEMYALLAEAFAEPADWICLAGQDWPLFKLSERIFPGDPLLEMISGIPAETPEHRRSRYACLFGSQVQQSETGNNPGVPKYWLFESAFLTGKILAASTFEVARLYKNYGLVVNGSELPDGISEELAFLSYLSVENPRGEMEFLSKHACAWMPALGLSLSRSSDPVYAVIGLVLYRWLNLCQSPEIESRKKETIEENKKPVLVNVDACTLCGFCAQLCARHALNMKETELSTFLVLNAPLCNGCGRCVRVCDQKLLALQPAVAAETPNSDKDFSAQQILRSSARVNCKRCGEPMVSRAELDYVISQIGHPDWLDLCQNCRVPAYQ